MQRLRTRTHILDLIRKWTYCWVFILLLFRSWSLLCSAVSLHAPGRRTLFSKVIGVERKAKTNHSGFMWCTCNNGQHPNEKRLPQQNLWRKCQPAQISLTKQWFHWRWLLRRQGAFHGHTLNNVHTTCQICYILAWEKQPKFCDTATGFSTKWCLRNKHINFVLSCIMMHHYPDLDSASDWLKQIFPAAWPIISTTQIWVVTHQYKISAFVSQMSFRGKPWWHHEISAVFLCKWRNWKLATVDVKWHRSTATVMSEEKNTTTATLQFLASSLQTHTCIAGCCFSQLSGGEKWRLEIHLHLQAIDVALWIY